MLLRNRLLLPRVSQFLAIGVLFAWPASAWAQIRSCHRPRGIKSLCDSGESVCNSPAT
jgi:hypothetical protein